MSENTSNTQTALNETGGDFLFADLFIQAAKETAAIYDGWICQSDIDEFYEEAKSHGEKRKKRTNLEF